jgi:hypothetical protein
VFYGKDVLYNADGFLGDQNLEFGWVWN